MKDTIKKIKKTLASFSIIRNIYFSLLYTTRLPGFIFDYLKFSSASRKSRRFSTNIVDIYPRLLDRTKQTGFDPHYTYHPAWAARIVAKLKPIKHIDISSITQFSTLVSAFIPVEFYDFRPAKIHLDNLSCGKADILSLPFPSNSIECLSCMHTIEHIGLGRYGDALDPNGDKNAAAELARTIKIGGSLIVVVPVGKPRIEFNAHRIYSYDQVMELFHGMTLKEFSMVPDDFKRHGLIYNADKDTVKDQSYACGCFWFIK